LLHCFLINENPYLSFFHEIVLFGFCSFKTLSFLEFSVSLAGDIVFGSLSTFISGLEECL